jgi:hypothetical protein
MTRDRPDYALSANTPFDDTERAIPEWEAALGEEIAPTLPQDYGL